MKMQCVFGALEDSIKNQGVFDTHDFLWKIVGIGGVL